MVKAQCQICHDCYKLEKFLFLPCGHGFCATCSKQTESQNTCAVCRSPKGRDGPRQIYITLAESNVEKATYLIQSLERIDVNSRAKDLEKKPRKIQKLLKTIKAEEEVARMLLEATMNMEERICPLFAMLEDERREKETLVKKDLEQTRKRKALDVELKKLRTGLKEARQDYEQLAPVADHAKDRWMREKGENTKLAKMVKRQKEMIDLMEEENRNTQTSLEEREKQVRVLKTKLKVLTSQNSKKSSTHREKDDPDESLRVEGIPKHTVMRDTEREGTGSTPKKRRRVALPVDTSHRA